MKTLVWRLRSGGALRLAVLACGALGACGGSSTEVRGPEAAPPPSQEAAVRPLPSLELRKLEDLRVGMRPGLAGTEPLPSTAPEVDAFVLGSLGVQAGCAGDDGWFSDEDGVLEKLCGVEEVEVGDTPSWLRFDLMRLEIPGEDGVARLRRIEVVPPLGGASGQVGDWSSALLAQALAVYGEPSRSRSEDVKLALWERDDRLIALIAPTTGDRAASLTHLGFDDADRALFTPDDGP